MFFLWGLFENLPSGAATGMAGLKGVWLQKETCQAFVVKSEAFDVLFRYGSMAEADPFSTGPPGWGLWCVRSKCSCLKHLLSCSLSSRA